MKNILLCFFAIIAAFYSASFSACNGTNNSDNNDKNIQITLLDSTSDEQYGIITIPRGKVFYRKGTFYKGLGSIDDPKKDDWFFNGWYLDKECTKKVVEKTGEEYKPTENTSFYAGWSDHTEIPSNTGDGYPHPLVGEIFYADLSFSWVGASPTNIVRFSGSITAKGNFTGDLSSDRIRLQINYTWYSGESFLGELLDPDKIVASVSTTEYLEKSKNFSIPDFNTTINTQSYGNFYNTDPILINTFGKFRIDVGYEIENDNPKYYIVQYKRG
ncbi:MAG: InlB B-repeat-containing protein [Clostridiales bacterium]|jgi:uncharacterized repeat protein (TIGR02543 family)|nr:InlB B-repeat-containing protein [Clostridiales bacterium]